MSNRWGEAREEDPADLKQQPQQQQQPQQHNRFNDGDDGDDDDVKGIGRGGRGQENRRVNRMDDDDDDDGGDGDGDGDGGMGGPVQPTSHSKVLFEKDGVKTIEEFFTDEDNRRIKVVKKVKVETQTVRVKKAVLQRRHWAKFGDCEGRPPGPEPNVTVVSIEKIKLDLNGAMRKYIEGLASAPTKGGARQPGGNDKSIVLCRHCGERGHWTVACPHKNDPNFKAANASALGGGGSGGSGVESGGGASSSAAPNFADIVRAPASNVPPRSALNRNVSSASSTSGGLKQASNAYVPPHARPGSKYGNREEQDKERDENTLRVSNLSEDASEEDVKELFRHFGPLSRTYLAKDYNTHRSRGFAFVTYIRKADAEDAIQKLNGHGYDNLILHVEWAKPREDKKSDD